MNDDFYIGWQEKAPMSHLRATRRLVLAGLAVALVAGLALAASQRLIGTAFFEWNREQLFAGVLRARPVPHLVVVSTDGTTMTHLLVAPLKYGFDRKVAQALDGQPVRLKGKRIFRDELSMIEAPPNAVEGIQPAAPPPVGRPATPLGTRTLVGEIVDSKCWLGVMNPGRLATHRACAVRCISGGIPPILLVRYAEGRTGHYLLVGPEGRALNREILDLIAEPVAVTGKVSRQGNLLVLEAERGNIVRLNR